LSRIFNDHELDRTLGQAASSASVKSALILASALFVWVSSSPAFAQSTAPDAAIVLVSGQDGAPLPRVREFSTHVERAARRRGYEVIREPVGWAEGRALALGALDDDRVKAFEQVERKIVFARGRTAMLRESEALDALAQADRIAQAHADVPGAAAWIAEVQTAIGITASQVGLDELAADAFRRVATLDPSRGVRAAEAPPEVCRRAAEITAAVAMRPRGSFQVRTSAPNARVFLDDRELGTLPRIVRAPVGTHVLRVEAPGRSPWGQVVEVLEGRRPPMVVALAPDPLVVAARRLTGAVATLDAQVADPLRQQLGVPAVWLVRVGADDRDRALLMRCVEGGCERPRRLSLDQVPFVLSEPHPAAVEEIAVATAEGRDWMAEEEVIVPPPPPTPWWRRWYVWVGVGAVVAGAIAAIAVATRPVEEIYLVDLGTAQ
jgi:hypothetical protein